MIVSELFETRRVTEWWTRPLTDVERANRSERFFWWRVTAILGVGISIGALGIMQVRRSSVGIRTAYELVKTSEALREQIEANRHLEAKLTGIKNPNDLRKEASETYQMHVPGADEMEEVD